MPVKRYQRGSHPYHSYRSRVSIPRQRRFHRRRVILWTMLIGVVLSVSFAYVRYTRPLPDIISRVTYVETQPMPKVIINWGQSQAAFGTVEQGVVAEKENQVAKPTASTAKLITVLTVLEKKPLSLGEQGPNITITQKDVDRFNAYNAVGGSTAQVALGEQLTEYQMIQGVLLPSANNLADTLAIWAFGSLENYRKTAQQYVDRLGALHTTIGSDASGFSPDTTSTASDLTRIGIAAAKHPVVAEVMSQKSVSLPVAGEKLNTNWLLGEDGVIGGKTGNTDQAGGVFVVVSRQAIGDQKYTFVGVVQGEQTVRNAILASQQLIQQTRSNFTIVSPIKRGQIMGEYSTLWGPRANAVSSQDVHFVSWRGMLIRPQVELGTFQGSIAKGTRVGSIKINGVTVPVILDDVIGGPTSTWRILSSF